MTQEFVPPTIDEARVSALYHELANRRSTGVGKLRPDPVDRRILERAMEAANWAPSNSDTEPWRFTIFTGEGREVLADAFEKAYRADAGGDIDETKLQNARDRAYHSPVWIAIGLEPGNLPDGTPANPIEEEYVAVGCAVQNMHLMLCAQGLIGMWHSNGSSIHPEVAKALGLEEPKKLLGLFFCGWPKIDWPEGERGPILGRVKWVESA